MWSCSKYSGAFTRGGVALVDVRDLFLSIMVGL